MEVARDRERRLPLEDVCGHLEVIDVGDGDGTVQATARPQAIVAADDASHRVGPLRQRSAADPARRGGPQLGSGVAVAVGQVSADEYHAIVGQQREHRVAVKRARCAGVGRYARRGVPQLAKARVTDRGVPGRDEHTPVVENHGAVLVAAENHLTGVSPRVAARVVRLQIGLFSHEVDRAAHHEDAPIVQLNRRGALGGRERCCRGATTAGDAQLGGLR